jgi:hypothetical protein
MPVPKSEEEEEERGCGATSINIEPSIFHILPEHKIDVLYFFDNMSKVKGNYKFHPKCVCVDDWEQMRL